MQPRLADARSFRARRTRFGRQGFLAAAILASGASAGTEDAFVVVGEWDARDAYGAIAVHVSEGATLAVVTTDEGTSIIDVTDRDAPVEVTFVPGPSTAGRSIAIANDHAYVATPPGTPLGGLQIIDLSAPLPTLAGTYDDGFDGASSLAADAGNGHLYVTGTTTGLHVLDLASPAKPVPVLAAPFDPFPIEHVHVRHGWAYAATDGAVAVLLVNALPNLELRAWVAIRERGPRRIAVLDDGRRAVVAGSRESGHPSFSTLDIADVRRITHAGSWLPDDVAAPAGVDVSVRGDDVYLALGSEGLRALDVSDPRRPLLTGVHAPSPRTPVRGHEGAPDVRGVAVLGTDDLCVSDRSLGLRVLTHATPFGSVSGTITDASTGSAPGEETFIRAAGRLTRPDPFGAYRLTLPIGRHEVSVEAFGFAPVTHDVSITRGETATVDVMLAPLPTGTIRGEVTQETGAPGDGPRLHPPGTIVRLVGTERSTPVTLQGRYALSRVPAGVYVVESDRFGFSAVQREVEVFADMSTDLDFSLWPAAFADNLESDGGWTIGVAGDDATTGAWVRETPNGTGAGYVQPDEDETPEPGTIAFVTGNGAAGDWLDVADVDGGSTTLVSPSIDVSGFDTPVLRFYATLSVDATWLDEQPDGDGLRIDVSADGGEAWVPVDTLFTSRPRWSQLDYVLSRYVTSSANLQVRFVIEDGGSPSIVEAAIDDIEVYDGAMLIHLPDVTPSAPSLDPAAPPVVITGVGPPTPNPFDTRTRVAFSLAAPGVVDLEIFDLVGRRVRTLARGSRARGRHVVAWDGRDDAGRPLPPGVYFLEVDAHGARHGVRIVRVR